MDVLAVQRGTTDPGRVIVISAHLDSRVSDVMNASADAPGAMCTQVQPDRARTVAATDSGMRMAGSWAAGTPAIVGRAI